MKKRRNLFAGAMAGLLLLSAAGTSRAEAICGKVPPLKPVRCVCGKLLDPAGGPLSDATVKVIKDGAEVATVKTPADGKFIFGELKPGKYDLNAEAAGLQLFLSPIVVASPAKKCKRGLVIKLMWFYPDNCGSYVVKQQTRAWQR
jgi:hypothetical protein